SDKIRVVVIDPHPLFRQGIIQTIVHSGRLTAVAEGATLEDARRAARDFRPDVLIIEIGNADGGIEAVEQLGHGAAALKLLVLTALDDVASVAKALAAGVKGYILKGVSGSELIEAVETIYAGQPYITPKLASRL